MYTFYCNCFGWIFWTMSSTPKVGVIKGKMIMKKAVKHGIKGGSEEKKHPYGKVGSKSRITTKIGIHDALQPRS